MAALLGAVEAGGTKFVLGLRRGEMLLEHAAVPTGDPVSTLAVVARFFGDARARHGAVAAMGLASFGPIELDRQSARFGQITGSPKRDWDGFDLVSALAACGGAPVAVDTDVNAAALAEGRKGSCQGLERHCYVTVGTGIGVGFVEGGQCSRAVPHAEAGHILVPSAPEDGFSGNCPYHGRCLEGMASGPAIARRWQCDPRELAADHPAWAIEAHYLAALCVNLAYVFRPQRIVLGGGVGGAPGLIGKVRKAFAEMLAGYAAGAYAGDPDSYIAPPMLVDPPPGLEGAFLLAESLVP